MHIYCTISAAFCHPSTVAVVSVAAIDYCCWLLGLTLSRRSGRVQDTITSQKDPGMQFVPTHSYSTIQVREIAMPNTSPDDF